MTILVDFLSIMAQTPSRAVELSLFRPPGTLSLFSRHPHFVDARSRIYLGGDIVPTGYTSACIGAVSDHLTR